MSNHYDLKKDNQNKVYCYIYASDEPVSKYDIVEHLGLTDRRNNLPSQLSGGQQQRVSIGRALYSHPAILLADEPTGNLDRKTGEEIIELLKESNRSQKQTLILITHDEHLAAQADRIICLEDGRVIRNEKVRNLV